MSTPKACIRPARMDISSNTPQGPRKTPTKPPARPQQRATHAHVSGQSLGKVPQNPQISDQGHLFSSVRPSQGFSAVPLPCPVQDQVNGSSRLVQNPAGAAFDIHQTTSSTTHNTAGIGDGTYLSTQQRSGICPPVSYKANVNEQDGSCFSYSAQQWLSQGRHEEPYYAFVAVGYRQQGHDCITMECFNEEEGEGAEARSDRATRASSPRH
ncbi:hypothetical protein F5X97DRAFT_328895 [Nemania serpens]|nr:hypothetical protein F5X97DRAFT_328895 [Nemania serpens]